MENDLISRRAAIDAIFSEPLYESGMKKRDADVVVPAIYEKIRSLPSAQPEPVKHGKWIKIGDGDFCGVVQCSECLCDFDYIDGLDYLCHSQELPSYCPNCGARMDGERSEK